MRTKQNGIQPGRIVSRLIKKWEREARWMFKNRLFTERDMLLSVAKELRIAFGLPDPEIERSKIRLWPVPKNRFGIAGRQGMSNQPIRPTCARKVFRGPIAAVEPDYRAEISKTADARKLMPKFDPLKILLKCAPAPLPERTKILVWVNGKLQ